MTPLAHPAPTPNQNGEVAVPDPVEILSIPQALVNVMDMPDGAALLWFQANGRRYQFRLDEDGRKTIGQKLLAPRVHIPGAHELPK